jgi:hypothetical protein
MAAMQRSVTVDLVSKRLAGYVNTQLRPNRPKLLASKT